MAQVPEYKDPDATVLLSLDWSAWLTARATTISASVWAAWKLNADGTRSSTIELTLAGAANTATGTSVKASAGVLGAKYFATNRITTLSGLIEDESIPIEMIER